MKTNRVWVDRIQLIPMGTKPGVMICFRKVSTNKPLTFQTPIVDGFQIHCVNELLRQMDGKLPIHFTNYSQYGCLLAQMQGMVRTKKEFTLTYPDDVTRIFKYELSAPHKTPFVRKILRLR